MNIDQKINCRASRAAAWSTRIDTRTCRPDGVYPKDGQQPSVEYVREFTEALGLKPAPTRFGDEVVTV